MNIKKLKRTMTPSSSGEKSSKKRKINRRNFAYTAGILLFLCLFSATTVMHHGRSLQAEAEAEETVQVPYITAESAVLIEKASGRILYEKDKDKQLPPASTTKIMTALVATEWAENAEIMETPESEAEKQLDSLIKVTENAVHAEGSSIYLKKDEEISLRDLLYGMMLRSGNDAAIAVAEGVGGSVNEFVSMMNSRAQSLGMINTNFENPNGLHDETHVSSAYDLAILAREAMNHDIFRDLAGTKVWNASRPGADSYNYFYNKNKTLFQYEGATGIKIGYTQAAGRCLVASAQKNGMELIAVVLNDHNWFEDIYDLFDYGFASYVNVKIAEAEEVMIHADVIGGEKDRVAIGAEVKVVCPSIKGEKTDISLMFDINRKVQATVSRWQQAGKLDIYSGENFVYSVPLYYLEDIDEAEE